MSHSPESEANGLPIDRIEKDLASYAKSVGIDLDALASEAGRHFEGDSFPNSHIEPLTDFEIEALCADDWSHSEPDGANDGPEETLVKDCETAARVFAGMGWKGATTSYVDIDGKIYRIRISEVTGAELADVAPAWHESPDGIFETEAIQ